MEKSIDLLFELVDEFICTGAEFDLVKSGLLCGMSWLDLLNRFLLDLDNFADLDGIKSKSSIFRLRLRARKSKSPV